MADNGIQSGFGSLCNFVLVAITAVGRSGDLRVFCHDFNPKLWHRGSLNHTSAGAEFPWFVGKWVSFFRFFCGWEVMPDSFISKER